MTQSQYPSLRISYIELIEENNSRTPLPPPSTITSILRRAENSVHSGQTFLLIDIAREPDTTGLSAISLVFRNEAEEDVGREI